MVKETGTNITTKRNIVWTFFKYWPSVFHDPWWRHQMEIFSALLALCAGYSPVTSELPSQRPMTRSFDVLFDLRLNKRLSKQSWGWWSEMPSRSLWRNRYLKQWLVIANWTFSNKLQWKFHHNTNICIQENASENIVCEITAILSRGDQISKSRSPYNWGGILCHGSW